ncbi:DUF2514 family protein [Cupriavidus basilensis]|uniref:DUF2514 family protein n=1 Tax=Cupriavidus basilensis TaxID=68895 RepID=UPI0007517C8A|nr:DUF2514 family protein [Cupriavidus basilensis]
MSILDPRVWIACALALLMAYGGGRWQQSHVDAATYQAKMTAAALDAARVQVKAVDDARIEEQRRTTAQTEIANAATKEMVGARADAAAANDAAGRLRQRVAELLATGRAAGNPAAASAGPAAGDPIGMLADVLGRADQRAGLLAEYADSARVAGQACERAYDALIDDARR